MRSGCAVCVDFDSVDCPPHDDLAGIVPWVARYAPSSWEALRKGQGMSQAEVNFDKRQAAAIFDVAKATMEALTRAAKKAGYPSMLDKATK